jgi:hypothetical protein
VQDAPGAVDVGAVEPEQFLGAQPGPGGDDRERHVARIKLLSDRLDLGPRLEREDVPTLVTVALRVADAAARFPAAEAPRRGPGERLAERPEDVMAEPEERLCRQSSSSSRFSESGCRPPNAARACFN